MKCIPEKHLDVRHNYTIDLAKTRFVNLVRTKTSEIEPNVFTKELSSTAFEPELRRLEFLRKAQPLSN